MAGPSVVVRVLGDISNLTKSFTSAGTSAQNAAAKAHSAFTSVLGTLNSTGVLGPFGEALSTIDGQMQALSEHTKSIGTAMLGLGGAAVGIGAGFAALGSKDQAAHQQL